MSRHSTRRSEEGKQVRKVEGSTASSRNRKASVVATGRTEVYGGADLAEGQRKAPSLKALRPYQGY